MSRIFWSLGMMLLAALLIMPVLAAEEEVTEEQIPAFTDVDKDKSGFISADESMAIPGLSEQIIGLDEDKDGRLSEEEFAAFEVQEEGDATTEEGGAEPMMEEPMDEPTDEDIEE